MISSAAICEWRHFAMLVHRVPEAKRHAEAERDQVKRQQHDAEPEVSSLMTVDVDIIHHHLDMILFFSSAS